MRVHPFTIAGAFASAAGLAAVTLSLALPPAESDGITGGLSQRSHEPAHALAGEWVPFQGPASIISIDPAGQKATWWDIDNLCSTERAVTSIMDDAQAAREPAPSPRVGEPSRGFTLYAEGDLEVPQQPSKGTEAVDGTVTWRGAWGEDTRSAEFTWLTEDETLWLDASHRGYGITPVVRVTSPQAKSFIASRMEGCTD